MSAYSNGVEILSSICVSLKQVWAKPQAICYFGPSPEAKMSKDNFFDGYIDGWQSIKPDSIPKLPAIKLPEGTSAYRYGFDMGRAAAKDVKIGSQGYCD
ncbi:hypothetical protein KFK14_19275 [Sphingobium phenoxybenzoativorans]|uniref:Uncharacterized protein n=1 Tax=Sphingobium phenoxybenzoativorans TaxID=1592790 RepID=A0A975K7Y6_9SPHN|nr:hypothetical protein [Sphingobium phenoxybenzoativorans]QUT05122.1 hypothetical protein KFK14_19275 [Sphingobium phenoxybenzoativorans]